MEAEVQIYNLCSIDIVTGSGVASHFCLFGLEVEIPAQCVDHTIVRLASLSLAGGKSSDFPPGFL